MSVPRSNQAVAETITVTNDPGAIIESIPGAGVDYTAIVHATGMTEVLAQAFTPTNTAPQPWQHFALDPNGNATITLHYAQSGEYLNLLSADSTLNVASALIVVADTIAATVANAVVTLPAATDFVFVTAPCTLNQFAGANTIISSAGSMTVNGVGGSLTIFDAVGHDLINEAPSSVFVGSPSGATSTINAATGGSDTILAGNNVLYNGTSGANSLFIGGVGTSTVVAAASETVFSGAGGGIFAPGGASFLFFGAGGSDTLSGGAASPVVWGNANERLLAQGTAGFGTFIALGESDSINAQTAGGNNAFIVVNETLPSGTFAGNTTLVGSNAGGDTFGIFGEPGAPPPAHTIVIANWHANDTLFLSYGATDVATADAALAAAPPGAGAIFTLSDHTTIHFIGDHPTVASV